MKAQNNYSFVVKETNFDLLHTAQRLELDDVFIMDQYRVMRESIVLHLKSV